MKGAQVCHGSWQRGVLHGVFCVGPRRGGGGGAQGPMAARPCEAQGILPCAQYLCDQRTCVETRCLHEHVKQAKEHGQHRNKGKGAAHVGAPSPNEDGCVAVGVVGVGTGACMNAWLSMGGRPRGWADSDMPTASALHWTSTLPCTACSQGSGVPGYLSGARALLLRRHTHTQCAAPFTPVDSGGARHMRSSSSRKGFGCWRGNAQSRTRSAPASSRASSSAITRMPDL